jgi:hypothetical protein
MSGLAEESSRCWHEYCAWVLEKVLSERNEQVSILEARQGTPQFNEHVSVTTT